MDIPFHYNETNFTLTVDKPSGRFAPSNYHEVTIVLPGLKGDDAFFILVAQHPCVVATSMQPESSRRQCTFLISAALGNDPRYTLTDFSEQIGYLVSQLKERVDWHKSGRDNFLLQKRVGHHRTAYITVKPKGQDRQEILDILKSITTDASDYPQHIGNETFAVLMPYDRPLKTVMQLLRDNF